MNEIDKIRLDIYESYEDGDISEYEKDLLLEKCDEREVYMEKLETNILDKALPFKKYDLYHVSNKKFDVVKANSLNMGTNLSKARLSSFWTKDKELAYFWAAFKTIARYNDAGIKFAFAIKERKLYMQHTAYCRHKSTKELMNADEKKEMSKKYLDMIDKYKETNGGKKPDEKVLENIFHKVKDEMGFEIIDIKSYVEEIFKDFPAYLYTKKNVPIKDVGKGQVNIDEYTLDKDAKIDSVEEISVNDLMSVCEFVGKERFDEKKKKDDARGYKSSNIFTNLIFGNQDKKMNARIMTYDINNLLTSCWGKQVGVEKASKMAKYIVNNM